MKKVIAALVIIAAVVLAAWVSFKRPHMFAFHIKTHFQSSAGLVSGLPVEVDGVALGSVLVQPEMEKRRSPLV